ncbi:hypothetical protein GCM10009734_01890 [Nonomuraea bangladeshensis]
MEQVLGGSALVVAGRTPPRVRLERMQHLPHHCLLARVVGPGGTRLFHGNRDEQYTNYFSVENLH